MKGSPGIRWDWPAFLEQNHVPYVTKGANVARNHVNIKCPFCGPADRGEHMGLSLQDSRWGCWRSSDHRGVRPEKLITAITGCSWRQAKELVDQGSVEPLSPLTDLRERLQGRAPPKAEDNLVLPPEFVPLDKGPRVYRDYLRNRGYWALPVIQQRYAPVVAGTGKFRRRVVIPVFAKDVLVGWTGRSIGGHPVRYLSHPPGPALSNYMYNADNVPAKPDTLFVVEGPLDVWKLDMAAYRYGCQAVGTLGLSFTDGKLAQLSSLASKFRQVVLVGDRGYQGAVLKQQSALRACGVPVHTGGLPPGVDDPGELGQRQAMRLVLRAMEGRFW